MKPFREFLTEDEFNLNVEFDKFNKLYFSGELPKIPVVYKDITPCGTFLSFYKNVPVMKNGYASIDRVQSPNKIYVSSRYNLDYEKFRDILVHEMLHEWLCVHQDKEKTHHGWAFKSHIASMNKQHPELHLNITVETPEVAKRIQGIRDIFQGAPGGPAGILKGVREAAMIHPAFKPTETPEAQKERASLEASIKAIDKKGGPKGQEAIIYAAAKERLKKMDDDLFKQLEERVKTLLGKVIEGNETALGELMVLAKQFPKSFQFYLYGALRTLTPERLKRTEDRENTKLDRELREKNEREEEAVNKAAAAKMVTGPIGTAILHGAKSNEETAATPEQMQKMMRKNLRDSPSGERMMAEMTKRGFTPSQVKQAMDALDPRAVDKRARQNIERPENKDKAKLGKFGQVLPNFVGQAREELFNEAIKRGIEPAVSPLEEAAKRLMKEAGIAGDPKGVVAEIRKLLEDRRSDIMARTGATKEQAEEIMKREQMHAGQAAFGQPAQRMGLVEFSHMTQGGILNNNIPAQQLEQLRKMNITLDMIARPGRPRVPGLAGK